MTMTLQICPLPLTPSLPEHFERACHNAANYIQKTARKGGEVNTAKVTTLLGVKPGTLSPNSMLGATVMTRLKEILDKNTLTDPSSEHSTSTLRFLEEGRLGDHVLDQLEESLSCRDNPIYAYQKGELSLRSDSELSQESQALLDSARTESRRLLQSAQSDSQRIKQAANAEAERTLSDAKDQLKILTQERETLAEKNRETLTRLETLATPQAVESLKNAALFQATSVQFSVTGGSCQLSRCEIDLYDDYIKTAGNGQLPPTVAPPKDDQTINESEAQQKPTVYLPELSLAQMQCIAAFRRGQPIQNIQAGQTAARIISNPEMLRYCSRDNIHTLQSTIAEAIETLMLDASTDSHKTPLSKVQGDLHAIVSNLNSALDEIRPDELSESSVRSLRNFLNTIERENYVNHFSKYSVPTENDRMRGRHWNNEISNIISVLTKLERQLTRLLALKGKTYH